jgi:hypothetical protein
MRLLHSLALGLLAFGPAAFADDMDDNWEDDDEVEEVEEDDEEHQNSLYDSPTYTWSTEQLSVTYDADGQPGRTINVQAYLSDAPGERPVVLVSHGGSNGQTVPSRVLEAWSMYFADHGYTVLAIAHAGRTNAQKQAAPSASAPSPTPTPACRPSSRRPRRASSMATAWTPTPGPPCRSRRWC